MMESKVRMRITESKNDLMMESKTMMEGKTMVTVKIR